MHVMITDHIKWYAHILSLTLNCNSYVKIVVIFEESIIQLWYLFYKYYQEENASRDKRPRRVWIYLPTHRIWRRLLFWKMSSSISSSQWSFSSSVPDASQVQEGCQSEQIQRKGVREVKDQEPLLCSSPIWEHGHSAPGWAGSDQIACYQLEKHYRQWVRLFLETVSINTRFHAFKKLCHWLPDLALAFPSESLNHKECLPQTLSSNASGNILGTPLLTSYIHWSVISEGVSNIEG